VKKLTIVVLVIFLLLLSYMRSTYLINFSIADAPAFIHYRDASLQGHRVDLQAEPSLSDNGRMRLASAAVYWVLFLAMNALFFYVAWGRLWMYRVLIVFLCVSVASALLLLLGRIGGFTDAMYSLSAHIKNFLLSPVFTATAYIFVRSIVTKKP
jgi:hypothetical protein